MEELAVVPVESVEAEVRADQQEERDMSTGTAKAGPQALGPASLRPRARWGRLRGSSYPPILAR